jgi:transcriptional regulator with XRE-family HTH domain
LVLERIMKLKQKLRKLLEPHGSATSLADFLKISESKISRWRNNPKSAPSAEDLVKIAEWANVSLLWLCDPRVDDMHATDSLTLEERYLLETAKRIGLKEAIDRLLSVPGERGLTGRLPTLADAEATEEVSPHRKTTKRPPKRADNSTRRKAGG